LPAGMLKSEPIIKKEIEKANTKFIRKYKQVKGIGRRVHEENEESKHFLHVHGMITTSSEENVSCVLSSVCCCGVKRKG
jgi:hypothetical protein